MFELFINNGSEKQHIEKKRKQQKRKGIIIMEESLKVVGYGAGEKGPANIRVKKTDPTHFRLLLCLFTRIHTKINAHM